MLPVLAIVFLVVPLIELYVIIKVGQTIGALNTVGLLILVSIAGGWLVKREGMGVIRRFRLQLERGAIPGKELADGVLIVVAGAFLLTPGFFTDVVGLLLLLPPVRAAVRATALARLSGRVYRARRGPL